MTVFITGSTGYVGRALIDALIARGTDVYALARQQSAGRLPSGVHVVAGDALDEASFGRHVPHGATFVHLVGTPHPSPAKAAEFTRVDLASVRAAVAAARLAHVAHFIYVSVAHPAPVMAAYIAARAEGESLVRASGMRATILRPWYVLGPGHRWPYALVPVYAILRRIPATRATAARLGLVTLAEMVAALVRAVEAAPPESVRIVEVPEIRQAGTRS